MESSGFSSPRADCFPAGLRVLVVDDDPTWLRILEKMLKKCNYEVTTCGLAREALDLLRGRKDGFDIVISDVNMPDMDGFKLLEHVGLEMDLPVIMMSVDGETSRVMKGVHHGACDYLLKPIRMKELRNIWQHVFRKRIHEVRDTEGLEEVHMMMKSGNEQSDDGYLFSGDLFQEKKLKDVDRVCDDTSSVKKARIVWTLDLHQKFVEAVNQIGFEKVGPKKILDLMGVPWLTRENVASHLQKYRLYLSRLQKEKELKATFGSTKDVSGSVCHQNPIDQNMTSVQPHNISMPMTEPKKSSSASRISFDHHSFGPLDSNVKSESTIQDQYNWSAEAQSYHFKEEHKPHIQTHDTMPMHHMQVDSVQCGLAHNPGTSSKESDKRTQAWSDPSYGKSKIRGIEEVTEDKNAPALITVQPESHLTYIRAISPIPSSTWNTKNNSPEQNLFDNLESFPINLIFGWDEKFNEFHPPDHGYFGNIESFGYDNHEIIADFPLHLYDPLKFDSEYVSDHVEYPVIDQGLFIA